MSKGENMVKRVDVIDRLKAACVGHPHAKIPWPHRLLHDAIAEIRALRAALSQPNDEGEGK
jgi:hypothetical protein